jgi:NitT/TauT family transport system ATP-binding protein
MGISLPNENDRANESAAAFISCSNVVLDFQSRGVSQRVLNDLSLRVLSGQIVSLLGPSGCGKSTLLRVIAGLIDADSGRTEIRGQPISKTMPNATRDEISFVFQEPALLPWRTVWHNVMLPLEIRGLSKLKEKQETIEHLLQVVGFKSSDWHKLPSQLSGGMKMRASIARAMSTNPKILLLDEPFAALDDMLRSKLNDLLLAISKEQKCTMLFVTHNIAEAIYLSDEIAVMSHGRIAECLKVPIPFPRESKMRSSNEFAAYYGVVSEALSRCHS